MEEEPQVERDVPGEEPGSFDEPGQVSAETSWDAAEPDEWTVEDFDHFESFDAADPFESVGISESAGAAEDVGAPLTADSQPPHPDPTPPTPDESPDLEQPPLELGFEQAAEPPPPLAAVGDPQSPESAAPESASPEPEPPEFPAPEAEGTVPDEPDWSAVTADADAGTPVDFAALWDETDVDETVPEPQAWDALRPADQLQEIPIIVPPDPPATSEPTSDSDQSRDPAPDPPSAAASGSNPPEDSTSGPSDEPEPVPPGSESVPDGPAEFVPEDWDDDADAVPDFAQFTSEEYVKATTQEYAGLAADIARASEEPHEQMAVSAGIPGIESGTVGLDDVVAASGDDSAAIQAPRASDLPLRVLTAVGLIVVFLGSLYQPYLIGALILIVLGLAAGEIYTVLIRAGHHPLAIFGFVGVAGAMVGTWIWEPVAIPMSILLTLVATLLFYGVVPDRSRPLHNTSLTMLGVLWIGGLGGFAFDIIKSEYYAWLVAALVVTVALMDIGQYFVGRRIGKRALAPVVSPKKTVEGLVGGVLVALLVGVGFSYFGPFDLGSGLLIGAVVAVVAPVGDLAVSVIKRAIGVKDMSSILPGHGGILDRIDAMIFTIPAMWIAYSWLGLLA
jgi:phosphatidate cytidylyltransferase